VPVILDVNKQPQLIVSGYGNLIAYDPRTQGALEKRKVSAEFRPYPGLRHGMVFVSTGYPPRT